MLRRDLHFAGRALRVEGPEDPVRWLHDFLAPSLPAYDTLEPDVTIRLIVDPHEHARLAGGGPDPEHATMPCVTLDSEIVHGVVWQAPADATVVFDAPRDVFYRREAGAPGVVEVVASQDVRPCRVALMRVVREYAMRYAALAGDVIVHAAAVCLGSDAFVIAGPKRAGKTTLLLHVLRQAGAAYVSNDRVALASGAARVTVVGIPTIVSIRREGVHWFPDLESRLMAGSYRTGGPRGEGGAAPAWSLSPRELCELLGVDARPDAPVAGLLFPSVADAAETKVDALDSAEALDALRAAQFPCPTDGMFRIDGPAPKEDDATALARIAGLPSFRCRLGMNAYRSADWLSSLGRTSASSR